MRGLGGLTWLGRHGGAVIAVGVFLGLLAPPLASLLRPLLVPAILGPFLIALLRIDWRRLWRQLGRPGETAAALLWLLLVSPALVHLLLAPIDLPAPIHGGLVLMAAAPPLMASGYLALMLGLDAALAVTLTLVSTALMPFTLPFVGLYLLGVDIDVPLADLMLRLALVVGGSLALAWLLRWLLPAGFTTRHAEPLDGLAVLGLLLFAIAIMDGVTELLLRQPGFVLACALAVYAFNIGFQAAGGLAFAWLGRRGALTLGLCSGSGNLGLLLAALADRASFELTVFVATAQLPIYTLPVVQRHLYHRWLNPGAAPRRVVTARARRPMTDGIREVLDFWFDASSKAHWFEPSAAFDQAVAARLGDLHRRAAAGELDGWQSSAEGSLALCILLDQAPRQLFRGQARAFATDAQALAVAKRALAAGFDRELPVEQRQFLYLPLMHSEHLADQERCVALYEAEELRHNLHHAAEHAEIIRRFGRFPHRNAALGRAGTYEEQAFLRKGGNHFGQIMPPAAEADP